jgi:hypothetical protein
MDHIWITVILPGILHKNYKALNLGFTFMGKTHIAL